jgi:hypothetical protein
MEDAWCPTVRWLPRGLYRRSTGASEAQQDARTTIAIVACTSRDWLPWLPVSMCPPVKAPWKLWSMWRNSRNISTFDRHVRLPFALQPTSRVPSCCWLGRHMFKAMVKPCVVYVGVCVGDQYARQAGRILLSILVEQETLSRLNSLS